MFASQSRTVLKYYIVSGPKGDIPKTVHGIERIDLCGLGRLQSGRPCDTIRKKAGESMKEFSVGKNDAGQRLDRFAAKNAPLLPSSLLQKYIRTKRIKLNGKRGEKDTRLREGDTVQMYVNDEFFEAPRDDNAYLAVTAPKLHIVYEDENLLLLDKRPGQAVHPHDGAEYGRTLIDHVQAYLYQRGEWRPREENAFTPALCNRIDRNTGGIVIAAKNAETLRVLNEKIKARQVDKLYLCIVHGAMEPRAGKLEGYLFKDSVKNRVYVRQKPELGAKFAATEYRTLRTKGELSLVECRLLTGRTHQIRAQFAAAGHPLLGDGKYGSLRQNKPYGRTYQALYSYKLRFAFTDSAGPLDYLNGREFQVEDVDFVKEYFG